MASNMAWSIDFVSDQTAAGTRFRALTVIDVFTREGQKITDVLDHKTGPVNELSLSL
jgi:hypothetical protein